MPLLTKPLFIILRKIIFRLILTIFGALLFMVSINDAAYSQSSSPSNIQIKNVSSDKIINAFHKVLDKYQSLHKYEITLVQGRIKESTMQAQPVVSLKALFKGVKSYQIKIAEFVRDSEEIRVEDLSEDVLVGWFAHEMGHLVDYEPYNNLEMIKYGVKYMLSDQFKRKVEYAADYIAITYGFKQEILASKHFILNNELLDKAYKAKIRKYYLSIEDVELCSEDELILQPTSGI